MDIQCLKIRLKPDSLDKVKAWVKQFTEMPEVSEALREESIHVESMFIEHTDEGEFLILYQRADDLQKANEFYAKTEHPANVAMRSFVEETWIMDEIYGLELIYDGKPA